MFSGFDLPERGFESIEANKSSLSDGCSQLSVLDYLKKDSFLYVSLFPENVFCEGYAYDLILFSDNVEYQVRVVPCDRAYVWKREAGEVIPYEDLSAKVMCTEEEMRFAFDLESLPDIDFFEVFVLDLERFNEGGDFEYLMDDGQFSEIDFG